MVVDCLGCFGFLVKCAGASWLLEIGFCGIFTYSCHFGQGVQNLCGMPGASILPPGGPFCQLGVWGAMGAAGRTRGSPNYIFSDFGVIWGFESFVGLVKFNVFAGLFPVHF